MLTLMKGALYQETEYNLNITVTNIKYPVATTTLIYNFKTGNGPSLGTV